jgi:protein SCO1/2
MANSSKSIIPGLLVAVLAIGVGIWFQNTLNETDNKPEFEKLIFLPQTKELVPTTFTLHTGEPFSAADFAGKWSILFFGFTHCPDICPTTLHTLSQVKEKLAAEGLWDRFQVAMVSVDPQRDTPARLSQYVPFFDQEFIGLTAELEPLTEFARKLGILFIAREPDENGNYDVDHSAALILLNPQGQMAGVISAPHEVKVIASDLRKLALSVGSSQDSEQSASSPSLEVSGSWIRPAPPGTESLAAYLSLTNHSTTDRILVGAQSPHFDEIMIHGTSLTDGMASMSQETAITIPAQSTVDFAPMSLHLMLTGPAHDLALDDQVPMRLLFKDGQYLDSVFPVQTPLENTE